MAPPCATGSRRKDGRYVDGGWASGNPDFLWRPSTTGALFIFGLGLEARVLAQGGAGALAEGAAVVRGVGRHLSAELVAHLAHAKDRQRLPSARAVAVGLAKSPRGAVHASAERVAKERTQSFCEVFVPHRSPSLVRQLGSSWIDDDPAGGQDARDPKERHLLARCRKVRADAHTDLCALARPRVSAAARLFATTPTRGSCGPPPKSANPPPCRTTPRTAR